MKKLKFLGVTYTRPQDFYAEMLKSDEHMKRVQNKLIEQTERIKAVELRKSKQIQRKLAKKGPKPSNRARQMKP